MYAYCLFCETQQCRKIAVTVEKVYHYRCISPQIIQRKWVKGVAREEVHNWLPGYVFVYTEDPIYPRLGINGIIRWLGDGELKGTDLAFAEMLLNRNGIFGSVQIAEVGDRCQISDPMWEGMQGTIIKLDRGRKRCCIEFEFDDLKRQVWVGYDIVKKKSEDITRDFSDYYSGN